MIFPVESQSKVRTAPALPLTTRLGPVHIAVTDRSKALTIWRDVVGLEQERAISTRGRVDGRPQARGAAADDQQVPDFSGIDSREILCAGKCSHKR